MEFEPHNVQADVESPALKTCKKIVAGLFDYSILSIIVIVLLIGTICVIVFSKPRISPVSFTIKRARFNINSLDQEDLEGQEQLPFNHSSIYHARPTLPPPIYDEGSGDNDMN